MISDKVYNSGYLVWLACDSSRRENEIDPDITLDHYVPNFEPNPDTMGTLSGWG